MTDQERYIQMLERENVALRKRLFRVREILEEAYYGLSKLLGDAFDAADPEYGDHVSEEKEALQHRIEEVLSNAE